MKIFLLGEEVLRKKALPVEHIDEDIRTLTVQMFDTMEKSKGVGLAAPQIGISLRLFVADIGDGVKHVFINPQITQTSAETEFYEEGCLSIPQIYEKIERPKKVWVQAFNEYGKPFTLEADGLLARVIQHEYDHLDGVLFIDRGDSDFKQKTVDAFKRREMRKALKDSQKKAKQAKIAAKKAALSC